MLSIRRPHNWLVVLAGCLLAGCAPSQFRSGVPYIADKYKATDAHLQRVNNYPCLRVDDATEQLLHRALAVKDLSDGKALATSFLDAAHADARQATAIELDELSDRGWDEMARRYLDGADRADASARQRMRQRFAAETDQQYESLRAKVAAAETIEQVQAVLRPIDRRIQSPIRERGTFGRAAPWFLFTIPSALTIKSINDKEYRGPQEWAFENAVRYEPPASSAASSSDRNWDLLVRYAPVVLQEVRPDEHNYDPTLDAVGTVYAANRQHIEVDTSRPAVYAYSRTVHIAGRDHVQLNYVQWYRDRPALKRDDPEQGHLDGTTLRITLDADGRPELFETVQNCGCYHRLYPSARLEAAAKEQFGRPEKNKTLSIEHNVPLKIDMIVPKAVEVTDHRPVVRAAAGWHGLIDVAMSSDEKAKRIVGSFSYDLLPYDRLEHLSLPDGGYTSMFYENGLAKEAQRREGIFFTPVGMLSAGQPRQRGTHLIHWDHYGFDDVTLLPRTLRLPTSF